jgi:DNA-binding HxlR family transcriptional regulator
MRRVNGTIRNNALRLLGVSEQLVYLALASLKKRGRVGIPSLREIEREIEMLYGPQISQKTISRVLRRLEEKGHIRRRLEVLA